MSRVYGSLGIPVGLNYGCLRMRIRLPREMQMEEDKKQSPDLHYDRAQLPDLLRIYYSWLFPYNKFYEWLDYGE